LALVTRVLEQILHTAGFPRSRGFSPADIRPT
jgi:hypothetical protein